LTKTIHGRGMVLSSNGVELIDIDCVFTVSFHTLCDVRYDFHAETMFDKS